MAKEESGQKDDFIEMVISSVRALKTISQSGIKTLLKERLENPGQYVNTPLIIWRSDYADGIQQRILEEVFKEYNSGKDRKEQKWFRNTSLVTGSFGYDLFSDEPFTVGTAPETMHGPYAVGMYVIDPCYINLDYKQDPDSLNKYHEVFNARKFGEYEMRSNIPVVAFMCDNHDWFETPKAYPNAEQYVFEPDFKEWAEWALNEGKFPKQLIDFIRGDGEKKGIMYRFYNCFSVTPRTYGSGGCPYPRKWIDAWHNMQDEGAKLYELSEDDIEFAIKGVGISHDVQEAFCRYITEHKNE